MQTRGPNIYKTARLCTCLTQETAAEALHLSVESVKAYETGQRVPNNGTVAAMVRTYGTPELAIQHLSATTEELQLFANLRALSLPVAALQLIDRVFRFADEHRDRQLVRIAQDGVIDERERDDFAVIVQELDGIVAAALQLKCCEGTKKERPDVGASKRSVSTRVRENHCTSIIPQPRGKARKICAGEAVTSL